MIFDRLDNLKLYTEVHPGFAKAVAFIGQTDLAQLADGRYEIDGNDIFVTIGTYALKTPADASLEAHDNYIDIQVVVDGVEDYGWRARKSCTSPRGEIDTQKDMLFFDDLPSATFTAGAGEFCVFLPEDCHAPLTGSGEVRKCVFKIKK